MASSTAALPARQLKTCHLGSAADVLDMLAWQIEGLAETPIDRLRAINYKAMLAAVTAWQLSDWTFESLPAMLRQSWTIPGQRGETELMRFQSWVRDTCPALKICYSLSNAFKHRTLRRDAQPDITSDTLNRLNEAMTLSVRLIFTHDGFVREPLEVLEEAHAFWVDRLAQAGLLDRSAEAQRLSSLERDPSGWGRTDPNSTVARS